MILTRKRVLVTGSAGFIGKNLVKRLVAGGAEVLAVDRRDFSSMTAKHFKFDILQPSRRLKEIIDESDVIFHLAAYSSAHMFKEFEPAFSSNVQSLLRVLDYAASSGSKKRVVFPSSSTVYEGGALPSKEDSVGNVPVNWYAASKLTGELLCKHYSRYKNIETVVLRIFCGYGPEEQHKSIYASPPSLFIRDMIAGKSPDIWGNGSQERDLVYIDDVVDAFVLAAASKSGSDTFNVGSGIPTSFLDLVNEINRIMGREIAPNFVEPRMPHYLQRTFADTSKAERVLGFKPKTTLRDGLTKTIDSFKAGMHDPSSKKLQSIGPQLA